MIPRKKIQLLLCTFCILYTFGNGGRAFAGNSQIETNRTSPKPTESFGLDSQFNETLEVEIESSTVNTSLSSTEITTAYSESSAVVTEDNGGISRANDTSTTTTSSYETTTLLNNCTDTASVENLAVYNCTNTSLSSTEITTAYSESSTVVTEDNGGISRANDTSTTTTSSYETTTLLDNCTDTASVENLAVYNYTNTTLDVTWEHAIYSDECVSEYMITWYSDSGVDDHTDTVNSTESHYTIQNLTSCTSYTISVVAVGKGGNSKAKTVIHSTADSIPGGIRDLTIDTTTGYFVYFTWSPPTSNPTCVLSYEVDICSEDGCHGSTNTTNLYYNATDLSPCLNYTFTVIAVGNAGSSAKISAIAETSLVTLSAPHGLQITPGEFSLFVSWEPPVTGSTCVSHYRVTWWDPESSSTTTDTNITLSNLSACMNYTVQIIASATSSDSIPNTVIGATNQSVNNPPTLEIEQPEVTKSTISITWRIDRTMNECELKSIHTTCFFTSTNGSGFDKVDGQSENDLSDFTDETIKITVSNLSPFSSYNCIGSTENVAGLSDNSAVVIVTTLEDVPSAPVMNAHSIESSAFELNWDEPQYLAGNLIEYEISLLGEQVFLMPSSCVENNSSTVNKTLSIEGWMREYSYSGATAYSNYTAKIRAKTNAGWGNYSDLISFQTGPDVPGRVTNVTYSNTSNVDNSNLLDTFLSWQLPCSLNGEIESFIILYKGTRVEFEEHTYSETVSVNGNIHKDDIFTKNFGELKAEYTYTFEISAKVAEVSELGPSSNYTVTYPAGLPPWPEVGYMKQIRACSYDIERTSSTTQILLPLFKNTNGNIMYYAIMISQLCCNVAEESRFDIKSGNWPNVTSWRKAMAQTPIITYQATPIRWNPAATNNTVDYGHLQAVKFLLGEDDSCSELSTPSYCNGPLRPDTQYQVRMRAFTSGGYRDSQVIIVRTKAEFNLGMVIGVVCGILLLGIITLMMLRIRKGVVQTVLSNILNRSAPSSPGPDPLPRKKFELHCQELIDNPGKLSNEFQLLQTLSVDLEMSATAAEMQANRKKNRYINILPYDISRVKLEVLNNDPNSDYINASLIQGYSGGTEYIACQGPKEETTYDFWRMIWEYNVKIIVMVTQLVEKGKDKCYQYYPNTRESFMHEDITIRCSTQLDFVFYTQRNITLKKENAKRTVIHLHFKEWSDHGVPDDVHSMINFCQIIRKQINEYRSLAVVHCSAGVGRTGTLIAVDILLQQIKDNKKLDVFGTVYRLRQHRMNMVQTESQYAYIYDCTKQALNNPYPPKQYKTSSLEPVYENLTKTKREITDSNTNLVASAETLKKTSPSASTGSLEPICELTVPRRPIYTSQLSTLSLRYSKSTSAINSSFPPNLEFDRYASHEYPIFEPAPDSPLAKVSMDMNHFLEFARPIQSETRISPSESMNHNDNTDHTIYGLGAKAQLGIK